MCSRRLTFKAFLFLFISFFVVRPAFASNNPTFTSSMTQHRSSIFERSDVREAIHAFCRTLGLNPKHKTAQENLAAIAAHPSLTAKQRSDVFRLENLIGYIQNLEGRMSYFAVKCNLLKERLIEEGYDEQLLLQRLSGVSNDALRLHNGFVIHERKSGDYPNNVLLVINRFLNDEKIQLSKRVEHFQKQYHWLRARNSNELPLSTPHVVRGENLVIVDQKVDVIQLPDFTVSDSRKLSENAILENSGVENKGLTESKSDENPILQESLSVEDGDALEVALPVFVEDEDLGLSHEVPPDTDELAKEAEGGEGPVASFLEDLSSLKVQLEGIEARVTQKNTEITDLINQVVGLSLQLSETKASSQERVTAITALKTELEDVTSRFELGRRIIQEKDEELRSLQENFDEVYARMLSQDEEMDLVVTTKNKESEEVNATLQAYRDDLDEMKTLLQTRIVELNTLKVELTDVQEELVQNQKILQKKNGEIVVLGDQLRKASQQEKAQGVTDQENGDLLSRRAFENKALQKAILGQSLRDAQLKEIEGILSIYKQSLKEANQAIKEKSGRLDSLSDELVKLQNRFIVKESGHERKDSRIRALKDALLNEKEKRDRRNISLRQVVLQRDQTIDGLEERLAMAQKKFEASSRILQEKVAHLNHVKNELAALRSNGGSGIKSLQARRQEGRLDHVVLSKDEKLVELSGILKIYKEKLGTKNITVKERAEDIAALERQLEFVQFNLHKKNEALVKTQHDLLALENQLTAVKTELLKIKDRSLQNNPQNQGIEGEVQELQSKLQDIHHFLLENLRDSDRINTHLRDLSKNKVF